MTADIRAHLAGLAVAFAEDNHIAAPGSLGDEFPAEFKKLTHQWVSCMNAASVVNARYRADWNQSRGALTVIAPRVREVALDELASTWRAVCEVYISRTVEGGDLTT